MLNHVVNHRSWAVAPVVVVVALAVPGCSTSTEQVDSPSVSATSNPQALPAPAPRKLRRSSHQPGLARRSPATNPSFGHPIKTSGCHVRGLLPDPACTPGSAFAKATPSEICTPGYSASVRDVPEAVKLRVYAAYGIAAHSPGSYEVDHLVSLELGGDNSVANLWPEISPGYREKDAIENRLHAAVCAGRISLRAAQQQIARDWRHTAGGAPSAPSPPPQPSPRPSPPSSRTARQSGFCATHQCIPSFDSGRGTIVQCADGEWSHSGGLPGVCTHHGGAR